jgi:CubicO group peptidase (beta-lactamase class C family)
VIELSSEFPEEFKEKFENLIAAAMAQARIPGLSVALVKDNHVIYSRGFGARNLKDNLPTTPHTLFGIGSCTKSFTALAIMQLVEQGKLNVQDPVNKYLPFKIGSKEDPVTIHHILTHSSGIPNLGCAEIATERMMGIDDKCIPLGSFDDFLLHVNSALEEVVAKPGKDFFYFNEGYTLLGEIVERISKLKFENYIRQKILKPLKMNRSTFLKEEFEKDSDIMTPYFVQVKEGAVTVTPSVHPFHKLIYAPGGLLSSVTEMTNYLTATMNDGVFEDVRILDASLLKQMQTLHVDTEQKGRADALGSHGKEGYGYGWAILEDFLGHKLVSHSGSTGVSSGRISFVPDLKIGVVEAANVGQGPDPLIFGALAFLMGKDPEKEMPLFERDKKLSMLAGSYETYKGVVKISVVKKGSLLYLEVKEKYMETSDPLIPETENIENFKFYIINPTGDKMPAEFTVDPSGKIDLYVERNRFHKVGK